MKKERVNLRLLDWPDIIVYCINLKTKEELTPKDLVDYFHFRYINIKGLERWTVPQYRTQTAAAKKVLALYGPKFSIKIIDILFDKHELVFGKDFGQIIWSIGIISSEKTGRIMERVFEEYNKEKRDDSHGIVSRLLSKPRSTWTLEERKIFEDALTKEN